MAKGVFAMGESRMIRYAIVMVIIFGSVLLGQYIFEQFRTPILPPAEEVELDYAGKTLSHWRLELNNSVLAPDAEAALRKGGKDALPMLIALLDCHGYLAESLAAGILSDLGPEAAPAVPTLIRKIEQDHGERWPDYCVEALKKIDPEAAANVQPGSKRPRQ